MLTRAEQAAELYAEVRRRDAEDELELSRLADRYGVDFEETGRELRHWLEVRRGDGQAGASRSRY